MNALTNKSQKTSVEELELAIKIKKQDFDEKQK